jgi:hypothetical protein
MFVRRTNYDYFIVVIHKKNKYLYVYECYKCSIVFYISFSCIKLKVSEIFIKIH